MKPYFIKESEKSSDSIHNELSNYFDRDSSECNDYEKLNLSRKSSFSIKSYSSYSLSYFSINSESNYSRKNTMNINRKKKNKKPRYIFCIKCLNFYKLEIKNNIIKLECDCIIIDNCTIDNFITNYTITDKDLVENNSKCKKHPDQKYTTYCKVCNCDLCDECLKETKIYGTVGTIIKKHETHSKIELEKEINEKVKAIESSLKIVRGNIPKGYTDFRRILNLIINIIKYNKDYYCYNIYQSLENISKFIPKFKYPIINKLIKIKTIEQIKENINKNDSIVSIIINNQKYSDLSDFKNLNLESLIELNLNDNEIEDISPLENCNLDNLERFDIERNKLNNKCINTFKNLSLPKIKWLNLFQNNIKSTEILDVINKFESLETFYIGENQFDKSELEKNKIYNFPPNLIEFGITGYLTDETIDFILKLKIEKLKIFYISRNHLTSLSFLKKIKFENLEQFWGSFNNLTNIKEIENLQSKETIKKINLKGNKISDINNILEIIKPFTYLEEINLEDNLIKILDQNIIQGLKDRGVKIKI